MSKKFIATISKTERVAYSELADVNYSAIFSESSTIEDILTWAAQIRVGADGRTSVDITDIRFSILEQPD